MIKIGAITVGQSPRDDVTPDLTPILGSNVLLIEGGGLDGLSKEEILSMAPKEGDDVLVSRLNDHTSATFAERLILPRIQAQIERMEAEGVELIMMFCTGVFPDTIHSNVPLIYPCQLLERLVPLLTKQSHLIVVTPSPLQKNAAKVRWSQFVDKVEVISASPYEHLELLPTAAKEAASLPGDLILLDCIGFSSKMKEIFSKETGLPVILPRTLLARVVSEMTEQSTSTR